MHIDEIMGKIPTFALPNEFLIWVVARFLINCDLDLILTEYYKEKLESQLENTQEYTTSIKSTNLTRLNIPTDWITCEKTSLTRPNLFSLITPPFSLLSLSPLPIPLFTDCAYAISSFSCTPSPSIMTDKLSCPKPSPIPPIKMVYSNAKDPENVTSTPSTGTIGSNKGVPASTLVYFHSVMPYPGTPGTPFFKGSNVTDFLD